MENIFDHGDKLQESFKTRPLFIFLDYDGTLSPIAQTPEEANLPEENKKILEELAAGPLCQITIISGRALADIKAKVGIENITYVGNHGFEIEGHGIHFGVPFGAEIHTTLDEIRAKLSQELAGIKGVILEHKGWTLSIHYRQVPEEDMDRFNKISAQVCRPYFLKRQIVIQSGKKVFELRPPVQWNKGSVIWWLLSRQEFSLGKKDILPIYIGDDQTDEDAFRSLKQKGIAIRVGFADSSEARYYLNDIGQVHVLLKKISDLRKQPA